MAQTFATLPSRAHLPVQMRVAVVSTPPAGTSGRQPIPGSRVQPRRQGAQVWVRQSAGRTQQSRGQEAPGTRSGSAAAGGGTAASSSQQHSKLPLVSGRPNAPPTVRSRNGAGSGRSAQGRSAAGGHGPIQAAQRGRAGGAGQRGSSPASGVPGHAQPGTTPRGRGVRSPYGGPLPGLVIGRARYAGSAHGPGSNSAGHGRAPLGGPSAGRPLRATGGHQTPETMRVGRRPRPVHVALPGAVHGHRWPPIVPARCGRSRRRCGRARLAASWGDPKRGAACRAAESPTPWCRRQQSPRSVCPALPGHGSAACGRCPVSPPPERPGDAAARGCRRWAPGRPYRPAAC